MLKPVAGSTPCRFKELYDADGWTTYLGKSSADTQARLGTDRITAVSITLRAMAEQDWTKLYSAVEATKSAA